MLQVYETPERPGAAAEEAEQARALGVRADVLDPAEVARGSSPACAARSPARFFFPDDGHIDPALFTRAMADAAAAAGAERASRARKPSRSSRAGRACVAVVTTRGDFVADQVVLAAGAWTPALTRGLGLRLPIEPAKGYSVDVERPADFPELPLYLGDAHVVLTPLGDALRLGSTLELSGWDMSDPPQARRRSARAAAARDRACRRTGRCGRSGAGRGRSRPTACRSSGACRGRERVILATGHCMLGLSLGPVTGRLVAELAGGTAPSLRPRAALPGRAVG